LSKRVISHIGALLEANLDKVLNDAEVVVSTRGLDREFLQENIRQDQQVLHLVNVEKAQRLQATAACTGICWNCFP